MDLLVTLCVCPVFSKILQHKNNVMPNNFNLSDTTS